ncbi:MAG: pyruvate, water dikinase regulatory protein [Pseudomonadota bacterium]
MAKAHLTLISDSTGETVSQAVRAAVSQFAGAAPALETYSFIRSPEDLETLPPAVWQHSTLVVFTLVRPDTRAALLERCRVGKIQAISLLDPLLTALSGQLDAIPSSRPGQQYIVSSNYFSKLAALDYAMQHDDGQNPDHLANADVILTGVSRSSKTPTCIYLAYQGIKAANIPLVYRQPPAAKLLDALAENRLVVGLTISAARLAQIRRQRLKSLERSDVETYADRDRIEDEIVEARLFFDRNAIPVIDVTRRSIEETAASIRALLRERSLP